MSLREIIQLKRINTMRARRVRAMCNCPACRQRRGQAVEHPLVGLLRALGAEEVEVELPTHDVPQDAPRH